jgi:hypothetical protein
MLPTVLAVLLFTEVSGEAFDEVDQRASFPNAFQGRCNGSQGLELFPDLAVVKQDRGFPEQGHQSAVIRKPPQLLLFFEKVETDEFDVHQFLETEGAMGSAHARLFDASPDGCGFDERKHVVVYRDCPGFYPFGHPSCCFFAPCPYRSRESEGTVVGQGDGLIRVFECHDRQGRAKGFLCHDLHRVVDPGKHGGMDEITGKAGAVFLSR